MTTVEKTTTAKNLTSTRAKATTAKTAAPGTKPRFLVVEKAFFVQTSNGELRLNLGMKFGALMELMNLQGENQFAEFEFLMKHIFSESELAQLQQLEWDETIEILMEYLAAFQTLVGTSMGKFGGSSAS